MNLEGLYGFFWGAICWHSLHNFHIYSGMWIIVVEFVAYLFRSFSYDVDSVSFCV